MKTKFASCKNALDHLRNEMSRRNEADRAAAVDILQLYHHFGEALYGDFVFPLLFPALTYLIVLAIAAFKIAITEKYISNSMSADEGWLLAKMRTICGDDGKPGRIASGNFSRNAVDIAIEWADIAGFEHSHKLLRSASEFAGFEESAVWRNIHSRIMDRLFREGMFLDLTRFSFFITRYSSLVTDYAILAS